MEALLSYITNIDLDWTDPYDQLDGHIAVTVSIVSYQAVCLLLWTIMGLGIVSYERFGEDPQKRGLSNQIMSQMVVVVLVFSWIFIPLNTWRMVNGPLTGVANFLVVFLGYLTTFFVGLVIIQYFLLKYLVVIVFKRILPVVDDFFAKFLFLTNLTLSAMLSFIYMYNSDCLRYEQRLAGHQPSYLSGSNVTIALMDLFLVSQIVIPISATLMIKKERRKIPNPGRQQGRNTSSKNREHSITLGLPMAMLNIIYLMIDMEANFVEKYEDTKTRLQVYLLADLFFGGLMIVIPGMNYAASLKLRKHLREMLVL